MEIDLGFKAKYIPDELGSGSLISQFRCRDILPVDLNLTTHLEVKPTIFNGETTYDIKPNWMCSSRYNDDFGSKFKAGFMGLYRINQHTWKSFIA
jgi:hypothetical protein